MNLPSFSRSALATGLYSLVFVMYSAGAPFLDLKRTALKVGPAASGAAANLNDHIYFAGGFTPSGTVTGAVSDVNLYNNDS